METKRGYKRKYSDSAISRLLEIAEQRHEIKINELNTYLDNLFEVSQLGCWQTIKNGIINNDSLRNAQYEKAMMCVDKLHANVKKDIQQFKKQPIEKKLPAFRIASFLDVDFANYKKYEDEIKSVIGSKQINSSRELLLSISDEGTKDYALLTNPVRKRFNQQFESELTTLRNIVANRPVPEQQLTQSNEIAQQLRKQNKMKI